MAEGDTGFFCEVCGEAVRYGDTVLRLERPVEGTCVPLDKVRWEPEGFVHLRCVAVLAAVPTVIADPPKPAVPDYDEIVARMDREGEDCFPLIKVSVRWPDGGGESPWARDLGGGLALMSNEPLYPKYRLHDIFRVEGRCAGEVVSRPFPVKVMYRYEPLTGEADKTDGDRRQILTDAVKGLRVLSGFFSLGNGYVLLREGVDPSTVGAAIEASGVPVSDVRIQDFDVATDKYTYRAVE